MALAMQVRFFGVRGSVPTPGSATVRYGGNTVCVEVRLAGWVARRRDHGGVVFIDLRDGSGIVQVVLREEDVAHDLRAEFCVLVTGIAQRVTLPAELECASPLIQAWVSEPQPMLVRVPSTLISGRWLLWGA